ncbi:MAG: hypothetical protein J0M08_04105 [Bacteroidetes bacterium]|nr:hypothetical protein [Bacteroidota bacterium]
MSTIKNKILISCLLIGLLVVVFNSCKKDKTQGGIPNVHVDVFLYSSDPNFTPLNVVGGSVYLNGGSRGLIVFRVSNTEFATYDRHCPNEPEDACGVVDVDNSGIWGVDACCSSKFLLQDGSVVSGPSTYSLRRYETTFDGTVLHVYNP